jgi:hypothetical protein
MKCFLITFRACYNRTALVGLLLDSAVLSDAFCEWTDTQVAHKHPIVTGTIKARLIGDDAVPFFVVLEVVIAAFHIYRER